MPGYPTMHPTIDDVIRCAVDACRSFAECSATFFNFERRAGWLGWENWLTVDIARRLNSRHVLPFYPYPSTGEKLDLFVNAPMNWAVEIKTNFITDREARRNPRPLPDRVVADLGKIMGLGVSIGKLLLVSTCFESQTGRAAYPECVEQDLRAQFGRFEARWHDCSCGTGHNLLLALLLRGG